MARRFAAALRGVARPAHRLATPAQGRRASIAAVFRVDEAGDEQVLFIKRATSETDPWSGNVALPGGGQDAADALDDERTAARETLEEVGIDVFDETRYERLGRIADDRIVNASDRGLLVVSMFGFEKKRSKPPPLKIQGDEVAHAWWVPTDSVGADNARWRTLPLESCVAARGVFQRQPLLLPMARAVGLGSVQFACVGLPVPPNAQPHSRSSIDDDFTLWGLTLAFWSDALRRSSYSRPIVGEGATESFRVGVEIPGGYIPNTLLKAARRLYTHRRLS